MAAEIINVRGALPCYFRSLLSPFLFSLQKLKGKRRRSFIACLSSAFSSLTVWLVSRAPQRNRFASQGKIEREQLATDRYQKPQVSPETRLKENEAKKDFVTHDMIFLKVEKEFLRHIHSSLGNHLTRHNPLAFLSSFVMVVSHYIREDL